MSDSFLIDIQLSDAGKIITDTKLQECFVTKHVVNQQQNKVQEIIGPHMCFKHFTLPSVSQAIDNKKNIVLRIQCCCEEQMNNISSLFNE